MDLSLRHNSTSTEPDRGPVKRASTRHHGSEPTASSVAGVEGAAFDLGDRPRSLLMVTTVSSTVAFLVPYAKHFRELGWTVTAAANGITDKPALTGAFDRVYELPMSRSMLDLGGMRKGLKAISEILATRPDIVHVHTPIAAFLTRAKIRRLPKDRRPLVAYTAHGFHFHRGGNRLVNEAFVTAERVAGRWTDRLVVMNDEDELAAQRRRIVPARKLVRMPGIGLDTEWYSPAAVAPGSGSTVRSDLAIGPDIPMFVVVGELTRRKRVGDILRALARMQHQSAVLAIAGAGVERARLESITDELGLRARVRFLGPVRDVRPLVATAAALVHASDREGLCRAIMEALALETPVVASTARGNAELVGPDAGFTVAIGDTAQLSAWMDWVVEHPAQAAEMGRNGRRRMVDAYDVRRLITMHDALYASMLQESRPG